MSVLLEASPPRRSMAQEPQRLELDSLCFSHIFRSPPSDVRVENHQEHHGLGLKNYVNILSDYRWGEDKPVTGPVTTRASPLYKTSQVAESVDSTQSTSSSLSGSSSDVPSLSGFLIDPVALKEGFGICIRRSDGRLYAIKKMLQTRRAWSELTILRKIKGNHVLFNQWLHWAFEKDRHIYFIMENYPGGSLADAIMHYGMLSPLEVFFFACEIFIGLRSLHDVGIIHHNVSPNTIIFDSYGHVVLSGIEYSSLQSSGKCLHDIPTIEDKDYQAPELLSGWNHDTLVDSWSFGMVLYFMFRGKHVFLSGNEGSDLGQIASKILSEGVPHRAIQLVNPIAKDLILKCLERNPALRLATQGIQHHPYFSNADWEKVLKRRTPGPLPREFLASNITRSTKNARDADLRGLETPQSDPMPGSRQPVSNQAASVSLESLFTASEGQAKTGTSSGSAWSLAPLRISADGVDFARTFDPRALEREAGLLNSLGYDDSLSLDLGSSGGMKIPLPRTWNLRKRRSRVINPWRYLKFKFATLPKLRGEPESIVAHKYTAYAQPIANLPRGLNQIGSGIGFTYVENAGPPAAGTLDTRFPRIFRLAGLGSRHEKHSGPSANLSSAPKSCGLFHGLHVSDFWAGLKSGSTAPPRLSASSEAAQVQDKLIPDDTSNSALGPGDLLPDQSEGKKDRYPIIYPLAESTVRSSRPEGLFSLLATPTALAAGNDENFPSQSDDVMVHRKVILVPGDEIIQLRKLKEGGLAPESTLRLVTVPH